MVRLNRIYTKAGDGGDTRLVGGQKVRKDALRIEAQTFNQRNVKRIREVYIGSRANNVLDYTDVRDLEWGGSLFFRLRKSFG